MKDRHFSADFRFCIGFSSGRVDTEKRRVWLCGDRTRQWVVTGEGKAEMLARLRASDESIPAGRVRRENSIAFTDVDILDP